MVFKENLFSSPVNCAQQVKEALSESGILQESLGENSILQEGLGKGFIGIHKGSTFIDIQDNTTLDFLNAQEQGSFFIAAPLGHPIIFNISQGYTVTAFPNKLFPYEGKAGLFLSYQKDFFLSLQFEYIEHLTIEKN